MRYLPPDPNALESFQDLCGDAWSYDKYLWRGFTLNQRTYIKKQYGLSLHVAGSEWVNIFDNRWVPAGVIETCCLWEKSNFGLPLHEFLDKTLGD